MSLALKGNGVLMEIIQKLISQSTYHLHSPDKNSIPNSNSFSSCLADKFKVLTNLTDRNSGKIKKTSKAAYPLIKGNIALDEQGAL